MAGRPLGAAAAPRPAALVQSAEEFCAQLLAALAEATVEQGRMLVELWIGRVIVTGEAVEIRSIVPIS